MKKLTSKDLKIVQDILVKEASKILKGNTYDFKRISEISLVLSKIDHNRREAWNKEHFGTYEKLADEVLSLSSFTADDIPF